MALLLKRIQLHIAFHNFYSTSSVHVNDGAFTNFLRLEFGFHESQVTPIVSKLCELPPPQNARHVGLLLKDLGFSRTKVRSVWLKSPNIFSEKPDCLKAKLDLFRSLGFGENELRRFLSRAPRILSFSLDEILLPRIEYFTRILNGTANLLRFLKNSHRLLTCDFERCILPNLDLLSEYGIEGELLIMLLNRRLGIICDQPDTLKAYIEIMRHMEIERASERFVAGLVTLKNIGSVPNIKERIRVLESFGLRQNDLALLFRTSPVSLCYSCEKIRRNMKFLVNVVGFPPNIVATYPPFLGFSLEGRLKPRYKIFEYVKQVCPSYSTRKFNELLMLSDSKFVDFVMTSHPDIRELLQVLENLDLEQELQHENKLQCAK